MSRALQCASAVLLHERPDGTSHFDWLIARDGPAGEPVLTFRVGLRPDDPLTVAFCAERLPDHRAHYLEYEGPLESKDGVERGEVNRLARGSAEIVREAETTIEIVAAWGGNPRRYIGCRISSGGWRFTVTPVDTDRR